ncbi:hemicentin-2-like protein [Leptotrombidium deliense]|uniref:Hemicentin-2-like protein n=1 Tax=Leptotrombidium deliense TaxID=299467 RepID=A0A443SKM2_9ACAR|nr:hemicentin-2-like protein [Leptotrombidium deliense]
MAITRQQRKPSPVVHWYSDKTLIDDNFTTSNAEEELISINDLLLPRLTRSDLNKVLTCRVTNNNVTKPIIKSITLDINLKPISVEITSIKRPLSAEKSVELKCRSQGSQPPAQISWLLDKKQLHNSRETYSEDNNVTISELTLVPSPLDNGALLICKADNLRLANSIVTERNEVLLECQIDSNPMVSKIGWIFNENILQSDLQTGLIIQNSTLVIKFAQREHSGNYSCFAVNIEGKCSSDNLEIVKCSFIAKINEKDEFTTEISSERCELTFFASKSHAPICKEKQQSIYGAAIGELTEIICHVDSQPSDVSFFWKLNNTQIDAQRFHQSSMGLESVLHFTPATLSDYGKLKCFAENAVGQQEEPCVFNVVPASRPNPVHECVVSNQTWNSIFVRCLPGFDGGMKQTFYLQVYDANRERLQFNVTRNENPQFVVNSLASGATYSISVFASNSRGTSDQLTLTAQTVAMLRHSSEHISTIKFKPVFAVIIALGCTFFLVLVIIVLILTIRNRDERLSKRRIQITEKYAKHFVFHLQYSSTKLESISFV